MGCLPSEVDCAARVKQRSLNVLYGLFQQTCFFVETFCTSMQRHTQSFNTI